MNFAKKYLQQEKEREESILKYAKKEIARKKALEKRLKEKRDVVIQKRTIEEEYCIECVDSLED